jgi:hypothetical protein
MKKRRIILLMVALVACYFLGPVLAGAFRVGERSGPVIYPDSFHTVLYIIAYESLHNEKPRGPPDSWMYRRPLFYGLSRRLRPEKDREAYIEMARRNESRFLARLIEMNEQVQEANKTVQRMEASRSAQETNQKSSAAELWDDVGCLVIPPRRRKTKRGYGVWWCAAINRSPPPGVWLGTANGAIASLTGARGGRKVARWNAVR